MKFVYATAALQEAEFVLIGVPDESLNTSPRTGSKRGPEAIRKIAYERCVFKRKGRFSSEAVPEKIPQKIHDYGDVDKKKLGKVIEVLKGKVPILLGGDHGVTLEAIKQFPEATILYFDAHPGILPSLQGYYGSVLTELESSLGTCIQLGIREAEIGEQKITKHCLQVISAEDFFTHDTQWLWQQIQKQTKGQVYVSVDLNVFDPAYAPGVSAPVPGGLHLQQVLPLLKKILSEMDVIGIDIVELTPAYDQDYRTAHLATKLLLEMIMYYKKK